MSEANTLSPRNLKRRIYEILEGAVTDRASHACEVFIASLVVANVLAEARRQGLSEDIAEPVWRLLIERCIAHELAAWDQLRKA